MNAYNFYILALVFLSQFSNAAVISPIQGLVGGEIEIQTPMPNAIKPLSTIVGGESVMKNTAMVSSIPAATATAPATSAIPTTSAVATTIGSEVQFENASSTTRFALNNDLFIVSGVVSALFLI